MTPIETSSFLVSPRLRVALVVATVLLAASIVLLDRELPTIGAWILVHPYRKPVEAGPPPSCRNAVFDGAGVRLRGWRCSTSSNRRGTVVVLHGVSDNRQSTARVLTHFTARGFDAIAYDSRAHGESDGSVCSYGVHEARDLRRVVDTVSRGAVVLFGSSLGAAVAIEEAATDPRISAVVAAEAFSDLRTVATERAPFPFRKRHIELGFRIAERRGRFDIDDASPLRAARRITAPTLLIHGAADVDTVPSHSHRLFSALSGPKRLILVRGAGHNRSLDRRLWPTIDAWIDSVLG